ncbi:MAG: PEP-CTERM sorting domain-containing protein [Planctomycetota bacterium]
MRLLLFAVPFLFLASSLSAAEVTATFSAQVEEDEIDAFGGEVDQAFFNVQGDDDAFTVYTLADFDSAMLGLSNLSIGDVTGISLSLAQDNAFFSADGALEFFLAEDTRVVTLDDTARYITDGDNVGAEVVGDAFGTLHSLGTGNYAQTNDGDVDTFAFSLDAAGEQFLIDQINSGGILRIIGTPGDLGVQATYSGATSLLDPAAAPLLSVTAIPEPGAATMLAFGLVGLAVRRRRR